MMSPSIPARKNPPILPPSSKNNITGQISSVTPLAPGLKGAPAPTAAFSLIELLLTALLLALLLAATVFSFTSLREGSQLEEGGRQFETLLRFARAHAAHSGRNVRLVFPHSDDPLAEHQLASVRVEWQPDPLAAPGYWTALQTPALDTAALNELVGVHDVVRLIRSARPRPAGASASSNETRSTPETTVSTFDNPDPDSSSSTSSSNSQNNYSFPPVLFNPDGSGDSVDITLTSRGEQPDPRHVSIRILGITGRIDRRVIDPLADETAESPADETVAEPSTPGPSRSPEETP